MIEIGVMKSLDPDLVTKTIATLPGVTSAERMDATSLKIKFSGGLDVQSRILTDLVAMNLGVVSYRPAQSALEDVYLNLIKATL